MTSTPPYGERGRGDLSALAPKTRAEEVSEHEALMALADRLEREEPSRELDEAIALVVGWSFSDRHEVFRWRDPSAVYWMGVPNFSESLDAAVSLYKVRPATIPADPMKVCAEALRQWT